MSPTFQYDLPMRLSHPLPPKRHFSNYRQPKVADVSRLLDPSYLSASASSSPTSVYADTDGNLHDPDYRHFPVVNTVSRRPAWERGGDDDEDDAEEFDERARLRSASPRERRHARYYAYEQPLPYARRSFEEAIEERPRSTRGIVDEPGVISCPPREDPYVPMHQQVPDWTPTCSQQIRRHWQALSLSVRFSIFRVQRRLKRKFGA
ncbi:hypothetical protein BGW80DRAFT_1454268 [Lactifluus volemus]|nr:hypothetical protein BGW80DRAFT_1454268 [Lactifluus volemus]